MFSSLEMMIGIASDLKVIYEFLQWLTKQKAEMDFNRFQHTLEYIEKTGELNRFLEYYYRHDKSLFYHPKYGDFDVSYPIFVLNNWLEPNNNPDSLLVNNINKLIAIPPWDYGKYIKRLENRNEFYSIKQRKNVDTTRALFNGPTYCLEKIENGSPFKLQFCSSDYYSYLVACESRTDELVSKYGSIMAEDETKRFKKLEQILHIRNKTAHRFIIEKDYSNRFWKLGINVLTVIKFGEDDYRIPISKRSDFLAEFPGRFNLIPSGTFQPGGVMNRKSEFKLSYTIHREFLEEFFGYENMIHQNENLPPDWFYKKLPEAKSLMELTGGKSFLYSTGFGIDALAYKPELTCMLFINDSKYWEDFKDGFKASWESNEVFHNESDGASNKGIFVSIKDGQLFDILRSNNIVPASAMALIQGLKLLKETHSINSILFK